MNLNLHKGEISMNNAEIIFTKCREVKSPTQAYSSPAGIDFYIPDYNHQLEDDIESKNPQGGYSLSVDCDDMTITIAPHGRVLIPAGIKVDIKDKNTCLLAANKSGVASKKGLDHLAELIDADYHGEIHINLVNTSAEPVSIKTGEKIIQFMHLPVIYSKLHEVNQEDFDKLKSDSARGEGGFGSSGN